MEQKIRDQVINDEWLICPLGDAHKAVSIAEFTANPDVFAWNKRTGPANAPTRDCPDCGGTMKQIQIVDRGESYMHFKMNFTEHDSRATLGMYPITGSIDAFLCDDCDSVRLYGRRT